MDEMYDYMKTKLEEMRKNKLLSVNMDFAEFARLFQLVCYLKQIKYIMDGLG